MDDWKQKSYPKRHPELSSKTSGGSSNPRNKRVLETPCPEEETEANGGDPTKRPDTLIKIEERGKNFPQLKEKPQNLQKEDKASGVNS